jgi:hypothetical protein
MVAATALLDATTGTSFFEWIHSHSFVSAHTDLSDWEAWCEATQRVLPLHEKGAVYGPFPLTEWCVA